MITEFEIDIAESLIATGLVNEVYHSVELIEDKTGAKFPAYQKGNEQFYIGPDDSLGRFAYIRQTGPAKAANIDLQGSCSGMAKLAVPLRVVVFKDNEKENHDALLQRLLAFTFMKNVNLVSFTSNSFQLGKQESPVGEFAFDATTFYVAIDVIVNIIITATMCKDDTCKLYPNPICKPENL